MTNLNQTAPVDFQNQIRDTTKDNKNEITPVKSEADGKISEKPDQDHTVIGYGFYQESLEMDHVQREMLAKKVKKKLDFILLPMVSAHTFGHTISSKLMRVQICFVYFLSFMDKSSLNYANAYGL
jgi:hypothetical protein